MVGHPALMSFDKPTDSPGSSRINQINTSVALSSHINAQGLSYFMYYWPCCLDSSVTSTHAFCDEVL